VRLRLVLTAACIFTLAGVVVNVGLHRIIATQSYSLTAKINASSAARIPTPVLLTLRLSVADGSH